MPSQLKVLARPAKNKNMLQIIREMICQRNKNINSERESMESH